MKFYICKHCGNVITKLTSAQVPVKCCGEEMHVLEAGVTDAAQEKHVPAVTVEGSLVKVEIGLARGKKLYDKRADLAKKDQRRELEKDFKVKNLY